MLLILKSNRDFETRISKTRRSPDPGFVGGPCLIKDSKTFMNSYDDEIGIINNLLEVNKEFMNLTVSDIKKQFLSKRFIQ